MGDSSCMQRIVTTLLLALICSFTLGQDESSPAPPLSQACSNDQECGATGICMNSTCSDPCEQVCGNNTDCALVDRIPHCECKPCFNGNPFDYCDKAANCECESHEDCSVDKGCVQGECVDPCINACGDNSACYVRNHMAGCSCKAGYRWTTAHGCQSKVSPECGSHQDCDADKHCSSGKCVSSCEGVCGKNAVCRSKDHFPACSCLPGFSGDPFTQCVLQCDNFVVPGIGRNISIGYLFVSEMKTRRAAYNHCKELGLSLVSINSLREQENLVAFIGSQSKLANYHYNVWTSGLYGANAEVLMARRRFEQFSLFSTNMLTSGQCIAMVYYRHYAWDTFNCDREFYFVCENTCGI